MCSDDNKICVLRRWLIFWVLLARAATKKSGTNEAHIFSKTKLTKSASEKKNVEQRYVEPGVPIEFTYCRVVRTHTMLRLLKAHPQCNTLGFDGYK